MSSGYRKANTGQARTQDFEWGAGEGGVGGSLGDEVELNLPVASYVPLKSRRNGPVGHLGGVAPQKLLGLN